jgi:hypothetical protein
MNSRPSTFNRGRSLASRPGCAGRVLLSFFAVLLLFQIPETWGREVLFRENFENLENWKPVFFPKVKRHTVYTVEAREGERYLKAVSEASASAIVFKQDVKVYDFPRIRWRWKVDTVYQKGNAKTKEGDDYPLRIYVLFPYDPLNASGWEKIKYGSAKLLYGEYPPHSALNYIWSSQRHPETVITNSFTDRAKMIPLRQGKEQVGKWLEEEVDIIADYERAFGEKPPPMASLAIMNDSDNTGESAASYIDFIEVFK